MGGLGQSGERPFHVEPTARCWRSRTGPADPGRLGSGEAKYPDVSRGTKKRLDREFSEGEYEGLDFPGQSMIMRGRRRRNRGSEKEPEESSSGSAFSQPKPPADSTIQPADADSRRPSAGSEPSTGGRQRSGAALPLHALLSDVATAHAELDDVLPPPTPTVDEPHMARVLRRSRKSGNEAAAGDVATPERTAVEAPDATNGTGCHSPGGRSQCAGRSSRPSPSRPSPSPACCRSVRLCRPPPPRRPGRTPPLPSLPRSPSLEVTGTVERHVQAGSLNPLPRVMAVANQKGGVGKTTTSVNLGAALAELGFRVLVIDLDPQGNATTGLGIDARNFELSMYDVMMRDASMEDCVEPTSMKNLFVAPATIALAGAEIELVPAFSRELKLKRSIESVIDDFDYVLIDCPPPLGLITVNALAAADEVLVPIQCEYYALEGLSQLMRNVHLVARHLNPQLDISTIVLTMYDARTKLADQVANEVRQHFGIEGVPHRHPADGPPVRGAFVRSAHHGVRLRLAGGHRLSGTSQGGQWWHDVAGWAEG